MDPSRSRQPTLDEFRARTVAEVTAALREAANKYLDGVRPTQEQRPKPRCPTNAPFLPGLEPEPRGRRKR